MLFVLLNAVENSSVKFNTVSYFNTVTYSSMQLYTACLSPLHSILFDTDRCS